MVERATVPEPIVEYFPDTGTLYVANGKPLGEGDGFALGIVPFFDRDNEFEVVAICFEVGAPTILKPFVDAMLVEHGSTPLDVPAKKAAVVIKSTLPVNPYAEPEAIVGYDPERGCLDVGNGRPLGKEATVAQGVTIFYDLENTGEVAGLRIGPDARGILKPLVDAVLEQYGVKKSKGVSTAE